MWVAEIVKSEWETLRLGKFKSLIVKAARRLAVQSLLAVLLSGAESEDIEDLAERYFTNKRERKKVEALLRKFGLSEPNIDAEAFRCSIADLAEINRRLVDLGSRRDKILQQLEDYRAGLAKPALLDAG
ncbi:hypothetical protein ACH79_42320 [Bradyrhizobium sp. CCBAU 051011]|uniref:hypothetical protein n=1 Tax=Bradyrhizobium sp. CCBAU 051011 TaxID=858422 RepID=UPI00137422FA|nr:hypothetical protein [Bradyrhizobium sp. CCBAU 051011]QHO78242.1 hypothetical protein ACH79_42320 [Bradyrhizobium sp. CCBAU 051011]